MTIVLPFPPATLSGHANGNGRWRKIAVTDGLRATARENAPPLTFADGKPYTDEGDIHLKVRFFPPNKRGDRANFPNRCKPIFDGLADAWAVNDARFVPHFEFHAPDAPGRVEIEVTAVGETE